MTPARLAEIIAEMRGDGCCCPAGEMSDAFLLLANICDAERVLRVAVADLAEKRRRDEDTEGDHAAVLLAENALRALEVEP